MGSLLNIFVVFVFFIFVIQSSTSSSLEINYKLTQLIERLDRMQTKMDAMRSREDELEVENANLTEQLDKIRVRVEALEIENDKWTRKFDDLEAENEKFKTKKRQQDEELQQLKNQISHPKFSLPAAKLDGGQPLRILSRPPTSCQELKNQNGLWPMDGIHLLKKNNTIQAAFCLFAADGSPVQSFDECSICKETAKLTDLSERFNTFQAEMKYEKEELKAQLSQQDEKIQLLEKEISRLKSVSTKPTDSCSKKVSKVASEKKGSPRASTLIPTSCEELRKKGHFANGVYLVMNEATNKIHAVFCQFLGAKQTDATLIGNVDLKTQSVHFNVRRDSLLDYTASNTCGGCIPFESALLNLGEAIDLKTGSFTAPVTGTYQFQFSAMGEQNLQFYFYKNSKTDQLVAAPYVIGSGPVSYTASLRLEQGELMVFEMVRGSFSPGNGDSPSILYSGWLVEEELQFSLLTYKCASMKVTYYKNPILLSNKTMRLKIHIGVGAYAICKKTYARNTQI